MPVIGFLSGSSLKSVSNQLLHVEHQRGRRPVKPGVRE
jgi:hypothetical protein